MVQSLAKHVGSWGLWANPNIMQRNIGYKMNKWVQQYINQNLERKIILFSFSNQKYLITPSDIVNINLNNGLTGSIAFVKNKVQNCYP